MSGSQVKKRRVEALRAERERHRAARARRTRVLLVAGPVAVVLAIAAVMVVIKVAGGASAGSAPVVASQATLSRLTAVPSAVLDKAGSPTGPLPVRINVKPPLSGGGKPRVLYVGAEYCPYCAAERWPLILALSRFGTFTGLQETKSSGSDVFPNTATFSFRSAKYTSPYLALTPVETQDGNHKPLQQPTPADQALFTALDAPPYVDAAGAGSIPFIDFGNKYLISGASYSPQLLAGLTHDKIAGEVSDPAGGVGKAIDGTANMIAATICSITGNKPGTVCAAPAISRITGQLNAAH